jgi:hypothetical protein
MLIVLSIAESFSSEDRACGLNARAGEDAAEIE